VDALVAETMTLRSKLRQLNDESEKLRLGNEALLLIYTEKNRDHTSPTHSMAAAEMFLKPTRLLLLFSFLFVSSSLSACSLFLLRSTTTEHLLLLLYTSVDDHVQRRDDLESLGYMIMYFLHGSSIRLWALSGEVLSHDSSPRWFVWYSGVPASQQNLEDTDEICADSRYHFDHGSGSQSLPRLLLLLLHHRRNIHPPPYHRRLRLLPMVQPETPRRTTRLLPRQQLQLFQRETPRRLSHLTADASARLDFRNPNGKLRYYYGDADVAVIVGDGDYETSLGVCAKPGNRTVVIVPVKVKREEVDDPTVKLLRAEMKSKKLVVKVTAKTKLGLAVGRRKILTVGITLRCGGVTLQNLDKQMAKCTIKMLKWYVQLLLPC
ncbi:LOW QUALITY PROTEIN: hypothetical protein HID58_092300, partial [Brassica napus]